MENDELFMRATELAHKNGGASESMSYDRASRLFEDMEKELIDLMVDRFLQWKLPADFAPDGGISFKREFNENTEHPMRHEPTGTNLLTATQAKAMIEFVLGSI